MSSIIERLNKNKIEYNKIKTQKKGENYSS